MTEDQILTLETPSIPDELWLLWSRESLRYIPSIDDAKGGPTLLACTSREEAENAARHQNDLYDCECIPVRVK